MEILEQEKRENRSRSNVNRTDSAEYGVRGWAPPVRPDERTSSCGGDARVTSYVGPAWVSSSAPFFDRIETSCMLPAGVSARAATAAVLMTLGLRLSQELLQALQDALPPELAGFLTSDPDLCSEPGQALGRQDLIQCVVKQLELAEGAAEAVTRAVLTALRAQIPRQAVESIELRLPAELVELWGTGPERRRIARGAGGWGRPGSPYSL